MNVKLTPEEIALLVNVAAKFLIDIQRIRGQNAETMNAIWQETAQDFSDAVNEYRQSGSDSAGKNPDD